MADFKLYFETLLKHEGGYVNDPLDKGGATKYGVTLSVWQRHGYDKNGDNLINKEDIKILTKEDAYKIAKKLYWDEVKGDLIQNQSLAEFIFDWGYNSGPRTAIKQIQSILGLKEDGIIGPVTLATINTHNPPEELYNKAKEKRAEFFKNIVKRNPSQKKFLKGWLIRNNSFSFRP